MGIVKGRFKTFSSTASRRFQALPPEQRHVVAAAALIALAAALILGVVVLIHYIDKPTVVTTTKAQPAAETSAAKAARKAAEEAKIAEAREKDLLQLGLIRKGEGPESGYIRQFRAYPDYFGFKGNATDTAAIKKWAGTQAHLIAIGAGQYDWKFGAEIRDRITDKVSYVLIADNNRVVTSVEEHLDSVRELQGTAAGSVRNLVVAKSIATSIFIGDKGAPNKILPTLEYTYTGESVRQTE